jgi:hypothetical protein
VFEKVNMDALFVDLNEFIAGPRGIDMEDYFANIFEAVKTDGRLFQIPLYVSPDHVMMNKRLFEGIGVSTAGVSTLSLLEALEYHRLIAEAFPDEVVLLYESFSVMRVFGRERLYDLATNEVFVNTPHMHQLLEMALQVPVSDELISFSPGGFVQHYRFLAAAGWTRGCCTLRPMCL